VKRSGQIYALGMAGCVATALIPFVGWGGAAVCALAVTAAEGLALKHCTEDYEKCKRRCPPPPAASPSSPPPTVDSPRAAPSSPPSSTTPGGSGGTSGGAIGGSSMVPTPPSTGGTFGPLFPLPGTGNGGSGGIIVRPP